MLQPHPQPLFTLHRAHILARYGGSPKPPYDAKKYHYQRLVQAMEARGWKTHPRIVITTSERGLRGGIHSQKKTLLTSNFKLHAHEINKLQIQLHTTAL